MAQKKSPAAKSSTAKRLPSQPKRSKDARQLVSMSEAIVQSASRQEATYWQANLETLSADAALSNPLSPFERKYAASGHVLMQVHAKPTAAV